MKDYERLNDFMADALSKNYNAKNLALLIDVNRVNEIITLQPRRELRGLHICY